MQYIYSQVIIDFILKAKALAMQILQYEMQVNTLRERFVINNTYYPLHIVVFEGADMLGYFNAELFEIGLNKHFIIDHTDLLDTLRHELAHYYCWITKNDLTHSATFRSICKQFGWKKSIFEAKKHTDKPLKSDISRKIQKLLALSNSTNSHEAESALIKANQLLLAHKQVDADLAVKRVLKGRRSMPKWHAIADILKTFGVRPVFNRGRGISYLEVFGPKHNVMTAEYIACYLDRELECLWKKQGRGLKGAFFDGIAKGYLTKIKPVQKSFKPGLIALENSLSENLWMPYPHLHNTKRSRKMCSQSHEAGMKAGANLTIRPAVSSRESFFYLESN